MDRRKEQQQLNIYIEKELHKEIKMRALWHNVSMKVYILQAIAERITRERKTDE